MQARGALAAVLSSALGGTAIGATRYLTVVLDPVAMGVLRFAGGFIILAAIVTAARWTWPVRRDWPPIAALGVLFFCVFPLLFNAALIYTTAARGALALSTLPLLAVVIGAILGGERPTVQKTLRRSSCDPGRGDGARPRICGCATGCVARRSVDGSRGLLHGALQRALAPVHRAERAIALHGAGDGRGCDLPLRDINDLQAGAVDGGPRTGSVGCRGLPRDRWRRDHLSVVGVRSRSHDSDRRHRFGRGQSDYGDPLWPRFAWRACWPQCCDRRRCRPLRRRHDLSRGCKREAWRGSVVTTRETRRRSCPGEAYSPSGVRSLHARLRSVRPRDREPSRPPPCAESCRASAFCLPPPDDPGLELWHVASQIEVAHA